MSQIVVVNKYISALLDIFPYTDTLLNLMTLRFVVPCLFPATSSCPSGFIHYSQGSCYKLLSATKKQSDQKIECMGHGAYLAEVDTEEELQHLFTHFGTKRKNSIISYL